MLFIAQNQLSHLFSPVRRAVRRNIGIMLLGIINLTACGGTNIEYASDVTQLPSALIQYKVPMSYYTNTQNTGQDALSHIINKHLVKKTALATLFGPAGIPATAEVYDVEDKVFYVKNCYTVKPWGLNRFYHNAYTLLILMDTQKNQYTTTLAAVNDDEWLK